jgi:hypothetical protein
VFTDTQEETDRYWNAIVEATAARRASAAGARTSSAELADRAARADRGDGRSRPAAAKRVMEAMMTMKKIDIARSRPRAAAHLLDGDALREVARLVDVGAADDRGVVGEQLNRSLQAAGALGFAPSRVASERAAALFAARADHRLAASAPRRSTLDPCSDGHFGDGPRRWDRLWR